MQVTLPNGEQREAAQVGFRSLTEHWNEYLLEDGSAIKVKLVATNVYRVEGETDDKGQPVYFLESQNIMVVSAATGGS